MKVGGPTGASMPNGGPRRSSAAPGFSPSPGVEALATPAPATTTAAITGLDALLMLQEPEDRLSRQRRAVRRAGGLLDHLDALKLAVLGEGDAHDALQRLAHALRERRSGVDDTQLTEVLDAVETRAAVELAKRDRLTGHAA